MNELIKSDKAELLKLRDDKRQIRKLVNDVPVEQNLVASAVLSGMKSKNMPVRNDPNFPEWDKLVEFVKSNFGGLAPEEISLAFKMGCAGKIGCDMQHYQCFSAEYVGRVLNAYNVWRCKELGIQINKKVKPYEPPKATPEEEQAWLDSFLKPWRRSKQREAYAFLKDEELNAYRFLETKGIEVVTLERKKEIWLQELPRFKYLKSKSENACQKSCRRIALKEFITKALKEDRDLEKEI